VTSRRDWTIDHTTGAASEFHGWVPPEPAQRLARWFTVDRPAVVLGSTQSPDVLDLGACARMGAEVVRRRSGGGVVLMMPGEIVWLDVVVPAGDPLWNDDVGEAMWWFGDVWADALRSCGVADVEVHRGPLISTPWSRLVCYDGLGAGEVTVGGAKAVGISQRRTRAWARLQSSIHLVWNPALVVELLAEPRPAPGDLRPVAVVDATAMGAVRSAVDEGLHALG